MNPHLFFNRELPFKVYKIAFHLFVLEPKPKIERNFLVNEFIQVVNIFIYDDDE